MALGGAFVLILCFVVITSIPPAQGASSLYLPLILKSCDPALTLTTGNEQILFGTPGDDYICEYGFGSNVTQYGEGSAGNDTIYQDCRGVITCDQTAIAGDGNDIITQYAGAGNDSMFADGGTGSVLFLQEGGSGDDVMEVHAGSGKSVINQLGGSGNDTMKVTASTGDDTIKINAGDGNDTLAYVVSSGTDMVHIDGGPGDDKLTVSKNQQNVSILSDKGTIICKSCDGGTTITVINVKHITLNGDDGNPICQYDASSPPTVPVPPPDSQFDNVFVDLAQQGDVDQIQFGTPGKDRIEEYGGTGNSTQYAEGSEGDDWILQVGGDKLSDQTAILGDGNDTVYQYGGKGDNIQYAEAGSGNDTIIQVGGAGNNTMEALGGIGSSTIEQYGGQGTNTMKVAGGTSDDTIKMHGGNKADALTYDVTTGNDKVTIDAGQGDDSLTINKKGQSFTLVDNIGSVICQAGIGGTTITVVNVEHITVIGDDGLTPICQWP
jgi:Ca2+-binding RTX toxin-like protein